LVNPVTFFALHHRLAIRGLNVLEYARGVANGGHGFIRGVEGFDEGLRIRVLGEVP